MNVPELEIDKRLGPIDYHGKMERRVIANLLNHVIKSGFSIIGVNDGDELTTAQTVKDAMEVIFNLDESWVWIASGEHHHYIFLTLGNHDPIDIICDWSYTHNDPDSFNQTMESFDPEKYA